MPFTIITDEWSYPFNILTKWSQCRYASLHAISLVQKLREDGVYMRHLGNMIYLVQPMHITSILHSTAQQSIPENLRIQQMSGERSPISIRWMQIMNPRSFWKQAYISPNQSNWQLVHNSVGSTVNKLLPSISPAIYVLNGQGW